MRNVNEAWRAAGYEPSIVFSTEDNLTLQRLVGTGLGLRDRPRAGGRARGGVELRRHLRAGRGRDRTAAHRALLAVGPLALDRRLRVRRHRAEVCAGDLAMLDVTSGGATRLLRDPRGRARRERCRRQARLPAPCAHAASGRLRGSRRRGALQGGRAGLRGAERPREPLALRPLRSRRHGRARVPHRAVHGSRQPRRPARLALRPRSLRLARPRGGRRRADRCGDHARRGRVRREARARPRPGLDLRSLRGQRGRAGHGRLDVPDLPWRGGGAGRS